MAYLFIITTSPFLKTRLLLLVLTTYLNLPAFAQLETAIASIRNKPNFSIDTVQAIHQLFAAKRGGANIVTGVGLTVAAGGVLFAQLSYAIVNSVRTTNNNKTLESSVAAASFKLSLPGLLITTLGIIKRVRFNRSREASIISAYEQGLGLPPNIHPLLNAGYFYNR